MVRGKRSTATSEKHASAWLQHRLIQAALNPCPLERANKITLEPERAATSKVPAGDRKLLICTAIAARYCARPRVLASPPQIPAVNLHLARTLAVGDIHRCIDGNGRMARFVMNAMLAP